MAPKTGQKKKQIGPGKLDWAVEGYDYVTKLDGDAQHIPSSLAGPSMPKTYLQRRKYWRCFSKECQQRVDTLLDGLNHEEIHWASIWFTDRISCEHKVCMGCSKDKDPTRVDGEDQPELRSFLFEDFSNNKDHLNNAQNYLSQVADISTCPAVEFLKALGSNDLQRVTQVLDTYMFPSGDASSMLMLPPARSSPT